MVFVVLKPWPAFGVVDQFCGFVLPIQNIPLPGNISDTFVGNRFEAMKPFGRLFADVFPRPHRQPGAIEQHEAGPVLSRICRLRNAVHLHFGSRTVVVLDYTQPIIGHVEMEYLGNISETEHVRIHKQGGAIVIA